MSAPRLAQLVGVSNRLPRALYRVHGISGVVSSIGSKQKQLQIVKSFMTHAAWPFSLGGASLYSALSIVVVPEEA